MIGLYGAPQADLDTLDLGANVQPTAMDAYGQTFSGAMGDLTRRTLNFVGDHTVRAGDPQLSADDANAKYGIEGQLRFNAPVTDNDAAFRHAEAVRQGYEGILNSQTGANPIVSFGASLAGSLVDPTGLALMAATDGVAGLARGAFAGSEAAADAGAVAARSGWIANAGAGALNFGRTAAEGAALNVPFVGADAYLRHDVGDDMSMGEALQDLALGAVFHTGVHYAGEAFGRLGGSDGEAAPTTPGGDPGAEGVSSQPSAPPYVPDAVADLPPTTANGAWLKGVDDMVGDEPVDVARHVASARDPDAVQGLDEASGEPTIPGRWMDDATAVTPRGTDVPVRYGLVEMGDLSTSHDDELNVNPAYPQELQPRDRGMLGAQARNYQLEQELNPRLLMTDVSAAGGAPIVAPDGTVESGNGRTIALRRSAAQGRSDAYSRYVAALNEAGYDTSGMRRPMLVRARTEPLTGEMRANLAREMNADVTERMSATEQAMTDAGRISDDDLSKPMESPADERAFHRAFLARVAPDQINQLVGRDGELSPEGGRRIRAALVARAYGDPRTVTALSDPATEGAAELSRGLASAAPDWARMRAMAARGDIPPDVDLTPNLNAALDLVRQAKAQGMALPRFLAERLGQTDMFSGSAIAPETEAFLRLLYRDEDFAKPREPGRVAWALKEFARQASEVTPGPDLFGATADVSTARRILADVSQRFATGDAGRIDLRAPGKALRPDDAAGGPQPAARPPLIDLRRPVEERPGPAAGGLRPEGEPDAERPSDQPDADVQPGQGRAADPVARLSGEEIAPADTDRKTLRERVKDWFDANLKGRRIESPALGQEVQFNAKGRDEALKARRSSDEWRLTAALPEAVAKGELVGSEPPRDLTAEPSTKAYHYLQAKVELAGRPVTLRVVVREGPHGAFHYDHMEVKDDPAQPTPALHPEPEGPPSSGDGAENGTSTGGETADGNMGEGDAQAKPVDPVAADPELKAIAEDNARLAVENGVTEEPVPETQKPATIAAAVRAAGQCLLDAASEVLG